MTSQESLFNFNIEDIDFDIEKGAELKKWLAFACFKEKKSISFIEYIFCSDAYLLGINQKYLNHDYFTDIITFPLSSDPIEANVFISVDRVKENAQLYKQGFQNELHRVMIHGILHLLGYGDKTKEEQKTMRQKEDEYLSSRTFL